MTKYITCLFLSFLMAGQLPAEVEVEVEEVAKKLSHVSSSTQTAENKQATESTKGNKLSKKEKVLQLTPNLEAGKKTYELCATCHFKNGWGKSDGSFPVIAGQHRTVIFKQLADIRSRNRENPTMFPFTGNDVLRNAQDVADVAGYIAKLEPNPRPGVGEGKYLERGKKLFEEKCQACHGKNGQGSEVNFYPKIQGQHYAYLYRQLVWIRDGRRKNADPVMLAQIKGMDDETLSIIADYISRMSALPTDENQKGAVVKG